MTKKHFCKLNTYWLQQYVYFEQLKHKVSWISYYKFPILEGSHHSAVPKLSKACYVLRCIKPFMSQDALKSIYYSFFHSLISYGIIFWGKSSYSSHIFRLQKKAVRIITGSRTRDSCRELFKHLRILPLQSQYILFLLPFVVDNKNLFHVNSEIHSINL
jgi:hypothetical protein